MSAYRRSTSINSQRSGSSIYRRQMSRDVSGSVRLGSFKRQTPRGKHHIKDETNKYFEIKYFDYHLITK
jgi:hypothetical protein